MREEERHLERMGKYQLVRKLASGGMAEVFLARLEGPMGFEKFLVVKRILPHLSEEPAFVGMFLTEANLAARLNHANIVQIFDFGQEDGSYFIAMEYVEGADLRSLYRRAFSAAEPIPFPVCARILALACEALAYAHELVDHQSGQPLGLIHRDISADNILVSLTGGVKLTDFGIAKAVNVGLRQQTQAGVLKGKLPYMSPEYLLGTAVDSRADIYALGVVLFELLAGRRPFESDNDLLLIQAILRRPPPELRSLRAEVPPELVQIAERALAKDRQARYPHCREMLADLERFLFQWGEPVGARQISELVQRLAPPEGAEHRETIGARSKPAAEGTRVERRRPGAEARLPPLPPAPAVDKDDESTISEQRAHPLGTRVERRRPASPPPQPFNPPELEHEELNVLGTLTASDLPLLEEQPSREGRDDDSTLMEGPGAAEEETPWVTPADNLKAIIQGEVTVTTLPKPPSPSARPVSATARPPGASAGAPYETTTLPLPSSRRPGWRRAPLLMSALGVGLVLAAAGFYACKPSSPSPTSGEQPAAAVEGEGLP